MAFHLDRQLSLLRFNKNDMDVIRVGSMDFYLKRVMAKMNSRFNLPVTLEFNEYQSDRKSRAL